MNALLALTVCSLAVLGLCLGVQSLALDQVFNILIGQSTEQSFVVTGLRLPRVLTAVVAGAAFGFAGVTFQVLLRNPLASPDIIGISAGASASAVAGILLFGATGLALTGLALMGGLATAAVIFLLSQRGGTLGLRLILVGIGCAALLTAVTQWMLARANQWDVLAALRWLTGSLNSAFWPALWPLLSGFALVAPFLLFAARSVPVLQLGDDVATGLGVRPRRLRATLLIIAVLLIAVATATTGPIAFVALLAGPIASRLVRRESFPLVTAGLTGAIIVLSADLVSQHLAPVNYPVGVVTGLIGAPFLLFLLARAHRQGISI
ncbi:MAG TPA: iron chelate uptake ABC transporter family permease subunit [Microbacteriaceae bacterium]|nr:iron chelate uptake ABC transporter family permease subunit [Microbacteriaceae bacterium]